MNILCVMDSAFSTSADQRSHGPTVFYPHMFLQSYRHSLEDRSRNSSYF